MNGMNREVYVTDGIYTICPLEEQDKEDYLRLCRQGDGESVWRSELMYDEIMWSSAGKGKARIYSTFDSNCEYCGSIEWTNKESSTPELGVDMLQEKRNQGIAPRLIRLFASKRLEEGYVEYFIVRISSTNEHSIHVFEKMGAVLDENEPSMLLSMLEEFKKVLKEEEVEEMYERTLERLGKKREDNEYIRRYKLFPEALGLKNWHEPTVD